MMVSDINFTWEILNAYVDCELDRAMSARVAAAAAQDAALAARIATLARLKACTVDPGVSSAELPPPPVFSKKHPRRLWRPAAIAASVALVLALGILTSGRLVRTTDDAWLASALGVQRQWIASASQDSHRNRPVVTISAATAARAIDLSDADLKLVYATTMPPIEGNEAVFLGYRGSHGCMVGLWIGAPQNAVGSMPQTFDSEGIHVRAWRDRTARYALLSKGMDPARIDRLAEAVMRITDPGQAGDDSIRTALQEVKLTGAACRV